MTGDPPGKIAKVEILEGETVERRTEFLGRPWPPAVQKSPKSPTLATPAHGSGAHRGAGGPHVRWWRRGQIISGVRRRSAHRAGGRAALGDVRPEPRPRTAWNRTRNEEVAAPGHVAVTGEGAT